MNLKKVVVECSEVFGDPVHVIISEKDHIRLIYSSGVLFELQKLQDNYIEYTIIYLGVGSKYYMRKIKTISEEVITRVILQTILDEE